MLTIWITILFFGYLSFIRRHETKADKRLGVFLDVIPTNSSQSDTLHKPILVKYT